MAFITAVDLVSLSKLEENWYNLILATLFDPTTIFFFSSFHRFQTEKGKEAFFIYLLWRRRQSSYKLGHNGFDLGVVFVQMFGQRSHEDDDALPDRVVAGVLRGVLQKLLEHRQQRAHIILTQETGALGVLVIPEAGRTKKATRQYLSVCVQRWEGGVQHAAPHLSMAVVQGVGDEEKEEGRDLRLIQVLGQLVQSQSNAASVEKEQE